MAATDPIPIRLRRRRALTLIEVLVALGVIIALSAIVLPLSTWAFSLRALDSARDSMEAVILQSRAHARLNGRAIEVLQVGNLIEARWFDPEMESTVLDDGTGSMSVMDIDDTGLDGFTIGDPWARRRMPSDVEILAWEDYVRMQEDFGFLDGREDDVFEDLVADRRRIAVLLPDGGALVGETLVLVGPEGDALRITVDPWTGRPLIDVPPEETDELFEEEEEEAGDVPDEEDLEQVESPETSRTDERPTDRTDLPEEQEDDRPDGTPEREGLDR